MSNKIGVGVITCRAEDRLRQSLPLVPDVDELVIVNDGTPYSNDVYLGKKVIQHERNKGVGIAKNTALRHLIQSGMDHLFLIEDDVLIKNDKVFEQYIKTAEVSGIWHLSYALQGPANRKQVKQGGLDLNNRGGYLQDSEPNPRQIVEYRDGISVALYPNCVGAFTYYLRGIIKHVGYFREAYKNSWEHVSHTKSIIDAGLHPEFWYFADIANSWEYLDDIPNCIENSTIAKTPEWKQQLREGMEYFKKIHGYYPQQVPDTPPSKVMETLERIEKNYAKEELV